MWRFFKLSAIVYGATAIYAYCVWHWWSDPDIPALVFFCFSVAPIAGAVAVPYVRRRGLVFGLWAVIGACVLAATFLVLVLQFRR